MVAPALVRARYPENARAIEDHQVRRFSGTPPLRSLLLPALFFVQTRSAVGAPCKFTDFLQTS